MRPPSLLAWARLGGRVWLSVCLLLAAVASFAQTLRVGLYENEPKIFTAPGGQPSGIFPDLLQAMADTEGWTLEFVPCEWNECLARVERGDLDLMPDVALTDERRQRFAFHEVAALHSWSQLYRRPGLSVTTVLDLQGRRIAVLQGSVQESTLRAMLASFGIGAELVPVASFTEAFDRLADGQVDLAAVNHLFGDYHAQRRGLAATPIMFNPAQLHFAAPLGRHAEVLAAIDRRLVRWQADNDSPYFAILRRWAAAPSTPGLPDWVLQTLSGLAVIGLLLAGGVLGLRRRVQRAVAGLETANHNLQATLRAVPDLMFEMDAQGRYLAVHTAQAELLTRPESGLIGRRLHDVMPADAADTVLSVIREALRDGASHGRVIGLPLEAGTRWFELSAARKIRPGEPSVVVLSRDITDRQAAEQRVLQLTRLYAALGQSNEAIMRSNQAERMMAGVCEAAVAVGGLVLAWVGFIDETTRTVRPQAWHGRGHEVLHDLVIAVDAGGDDVAVPTALTLRTNAPYWCQDYLSDPRLVQWYELADAQGWRSLATIPLHRAGEPKGVLALYAPVLNAFDEQTQGVLLRMAQALEFGLEKLEQDEERRRLLARLRQSEQRYRQITESIHDVIWTLDTATLRFTYVSPAVQRLRGYTPEEILAQPLASALTPADFAVVRDRIQRRLDDFRSGRIGPQDYVVQELQQPCKDGTLVWTEVVTNLVENPVTGVIEMHGVTRDISERKVAQARIEQLAHFDQLTGLPNRSQLRRAFEQNLAIAQRHGQPLAVVFVDLDHFKTINDSLGHDVGDELLVVVAERLRQVCRAADIASRMGGDEFIVVLPDTNAAGAVQFAQRLLETMRRPVRVSVNDISVGLSLGIALYPEDGADVDTLLRNADAAMYQAKAMGRNDFRFFTPELQARSDRMLVLSTALALALERDQMALHYQPLVSLRTGAIVGAEALLRWRHPELGDVSPAEFIPVAESTGRILPLGRWVLGNAARQAAAWAADGHGWLVAVNISAVQFRHRDFVAEVQAALQTSDAAADRLELELTESIPMGEPAAAAAVLARLSDLAVRVSIDDFGTGYSSLGYLKKVGFYKLKIDRSFVADIGRDPDDEAIITAIIKLAQALGMQTLAEGVETWDQARFLSDAGCDCMQGWLVSPAVPAPDLEALARTHDASAFLQRLRHG